MMTKSTDKITTVNLLTTMNTTNACINLNDLLSITVTNLRTLPITTIIQNSLTDPDINIDRYPDLTQILFVRLIFLILYFIVMISAFLGNILITYIVLSNRKMRTVVNYYIVNLAFCDIIISIFVLPTKVIELLAPADWFALNETVDQICMVMFFLQTVVVFASVLTLVATCFER